MKSNEVRELDTKSLEEKLENTIDQLHQLKLTHSISPLENPSQLRELNK